MTDRPKLICPYCGDWLTDMQSACCGEVGHAIEEYDQNAEEELQQQAAMAAEESE